MILAYKNIKTIIYLAIISTVVLGLFAALAPTKVDARHNINHCAQIVGSDNNADFDACVAAAPNTVSEQSAWCEANRSDSEFESCMLNEFGVNVRTTADSGTGTGSGPRTTGSYSLDANCEEGITSDDCSITTYLVLIVNMLSALVGIVVVVSIIIGGFQYASAGSDPQKVSAAKDRIRNAIIALIFFIGMYSIIQWLIPGGLF